MSIDIFDVDEIDSILRQRIREGREVNLKEFDIPVYEIDPVYTTEEFRFSPERNIYLRQVRSTIEPISVKAEESGFDHNVFTALYEAVLNAHQHGNKKAPDKKVILAHNIEEETARFAVVDEGGMIDPEFISFVLRHREKRHKEDGERKGKILDFYRFIGKDKPEYNNGTGTSFIHMYMDGVSYFKYIGGGLALHLTKKKK